MARINSNYLKLPGSYLFAEMKRKTDAYKAAHPEADIIRLGIGDVTRPLVPGGDRRDAPRGRRNGQRRNLPRLRPGTGL